MEVWTVESNDSILFCDLGTLTLEGNKLNGTIPSEFGFLDNLEVFSVHHNDFVGEMPLEFCIMAEKNETTLVADCLEVACECCTLCCYGCRGESDGVLTEGTLGPATPTLEPTGLLDVLKPTIKDLQDQQDNQQGFFNLPVPVAAGVNDDPSPLPSDLPSLAPTTPCVSTVNVSRSCYERAAISIGVEFFDCMPQEGAWIGLFNEGYFNWHPVGTAAPSSGIVDSWLPTCGRRQCTIPKESGSITLGSGKLREGAYRVFLVRNGTTIATSDTIDIARSC